ncbi:MAG: COX15/CtaA family protein [Deltaproteobacteria bacterium]|nr:COX15/CtaA family protein [Deltaproteobacteria bacterium]
MHSDPALRRPLSRYAWTVLGFNLVVILWGAVVRATGSGAGCGNHWPLCDGEVVPTEPKVETLIELSHRLTSGLALLMVIALVVWVWRRFPAGHLARKGAMASLILIFVEALIGAGIVLLELVADNSSWARAGYMALHLGNTFLLLASLTLTARWTSLGEPGDRRWVRNRLLWASFVGLLLTGMTGAISALGDTLFPAASLTEAIAQDVAAGSHFLIKLRVFHPLIAVVAALMVLTFCRRELESPLRSSRSTLLCQLLMALVLLQVACGVANIALLAPIWIQLIHLLLADGVWILLVLLADSQTDRPAQEPSFTPPRHPS